MAKGEAVHWELSVYGKHAESHGVSYEADVQCPGVGVTNMIEDESLACPVGEPAFTTPVTGAPSG